jgi:hypothetical protein
MHIQNGRLLARVWPADCDEIRGLTEPASHLIETTPAFYSHGKRTKTTAPRWRRSSSIGIYMAACAILWRRIVRNTPYCKPNAASFVPTEPTEINHAQMVK